MGVHAKTHAARRQSLGRTVEIDSTVAQHDDAIEDVLNRTELVRDEQYASAIVNSAVHDVAKRFLGCGVDPGHRLVKDQEIRFANQRSRDENPLLLPTGQLGKPAVSAISETHRSEGGHNRGRTCLTTYPGTATQQAGSDYLVDRCRNIGIEPRPLRHIANFDRTTGMLNVTMLRMPQIEQESKKRGLSRAIPSNEGAELAGPDIKAHRLQHGPVGMRKRHTNRSDQHRARLMRALRHQLHDNAPSKAVRFSRIFEA